jgi:hypothetical protein
MGHPATIRGKTMRKIASVLVSILISAPAYGQGVISGEYGAPITLGSGTVPDGTNGITLTGTVGALPSVYTTSTGLPPCAEQEKPATAVEDEGSYFTHQHYHQKESIK